MASKNDSIVKENFPIPRNIITFSSEIIEAHFYFVLSSVIVNNRTEYSGTSDSLLQYAEQFEVSVKLKLF